MQITSCSLLPNVATLPVRRVTLQMSPVHRRALVGTQDVTGNDLEINFSYFIRTSWKNKDLKNR